MHCFIWFIATGIAAAAASRPIISITRTAPLHSSNGEAIGRGYQEQDTARGFYSYGYSDENAAKAEYTTQDGSSRGFYSYVDANGKLQTVKYEAGGRQGFKAEASNQPKAPIDDKKPVTDTAEVQEARQAHLSAIREAEDQERLAKLREQTEREEQQELRQNEQPLSDEDADILERVRAELTSMLAERQRGEENEKESETDGSQDQHQERHLPSAHEQRLQLTNDAKDLRLRTVYSLADISSSSYLKLSDLGDRQELPASSYYSYSSPSAKYSVQHPVALSRSLLLSKRN